MPWEALTPALRKRQRTWAATEIGADGYSEDAQNAVEVVGKLLAERDKNK